MNSLAQIQYAFAAYIREPTVHPVPAGIEPRRMRMYRELFYNNVENFLSGNFPILRSLYDDAAWHALAQDFFARHRCHTPYFYAIPEEFLAFLRDERGEQVSDPPFMRELAHYEWAEMVVTIAAAEPPPPLEGSLLDQPLTLSELAWPLAYHWPVHRIGPQNQPRQAPEQATLLVICRNRQDQVRFMEINPVTYRLLALLQAEPGKTGAEYLDRIALELDHPDPAVVRQGGMEILRELAERQVVGTILAG
ncbi:MAG: DUF2063 domain-containing protein [Methylococcaceae bacterium]|nr:MAG: DUF2063 domain-containing protein [Methylococcaceae bacterium]